MISLPKLLPAFTLLAFLGACQAGPSAFDKPEDIGPEDTADVATLPEVPRAVEVEVPAVDSTEEGAAPAPAPADTVPAVASGEPLHFERPEHIRGIYLNAWASGSTRRVDALLELARRTEINTFVLDIKDATGYVSHRTQVPLAREIGATEEIRIRDLPAVLRKLHAAGVYPIARIVIVKDPLLAAARPDLAAQDKAGGIFKDGKGIIWLNPYNEGVWKYNVDLAREVVGMGFPEVQWDYVRFPDIPASDKARVVYPGAGDKPMAEAIRELLEYSRAELQPLGATVTADVFGVTTSASRDVGIGQVWESFIGAVDVALPMVYPSHYWEGSFGRKTPNAFPYEIVRRALEDALRRSATVEGAGATRPWLQDFTLGKPAYGAAEVRAQIQGTYDAGIQDWILWNPGSRYTEEALEPVGGFTEEPLIRIANRVVPVSQRIAVLDSVARTRVLQSAPAPTSSQADTTKPTVPREVPPDTLGAR
ncbi:MAG TPA: putative glycoside hydrolase [Longimicrobiales bacterium]|nr:putative glycoside hydrolase [Longimicrobiales bacterium]